MVSGLCGLTVKASGGSRTRTPHQRVPSVHCAEVLDRPHETNPALLRRYPQGVTPLNLVGDRKDNPVGATGGGDIGKGTNQVGTRNQPGKLFRVRKSATVMALAEIVIIGYGGGCFGRGTACVSHLVRFKLMLIFSWR
jgi:hypothetical protein